MGKFPKAIEGHLSLTSHSLAGMYKGNNGSEVIVQRFVISLHAPCKGDPYPSLFSVEELAKKKGVKMAQIAVAWSIKRVTAPIVGTTKLQNLKEMIGEWDRAEMPDYRPECSLKIQRLSISNSRRKRPSTWRNPTCPILFWVPVERALKNTGNGCIP